MSRSTENVIQKFSTAGQSVNIVGVSIETKILGQNDSAYTRSWPSITSCYVKKLNNKNCGLVCDLFVIM